MFSRSLQEIWLRFEFGQFQMQIGSGIWAHQSAAFESQFDYSLIGITDRLFTHSYHSTTIHSLESRITVRLFTHSYHSSTTHCIGHSSTIHSLKSQLERPQQPQRGLEFLESGGRQAEQPSDGLVALAEIKHYA